MAKNGTITREEIATNDAINVGLEIAKNIEIAYNATEKLKKAALEFNQIAKEFKISKSEKEYIEIKEREIQLTKTAIQADKDRAKALQEVEKARLTETKNTESLTNAIIKEERVKQEKLKTDKLALDIQAKKDRATKREIDDSDRKAKSLALETQRAIEASRPYVLLSKRQLEASKRLQDLIVRGKLADQTQKQYNRELRTAQKEFDTLNKKVLSADKAVAKFNRNVGNYPKQAISSISDLIGAFGVAGGIMLFANTVKKAFDTIVEFDKQLIAVGKTTNMSGQELKNFGNNVVTLGIQLKGISIQGLLEASEIAGQLGIKGSANILKFAKTTQLLALTSDLIGKESIQNFAKFIEVSSDTVENADRLGSVITELGNNFASTENQILSNATEIQKGVAVYNTSADSVLALGAATNALGSEAEASRSAIQSAFAVLNKAISTGENLEKILKLTGYTQKELSAQFNKDATVVFQRFIEGLNKAGKAGANLSNDLGALGITEKRAFTVVGTLAKNYDTLEDAMKRANEEYKNNTALSEEAAASAKSVASRIGDMTDSWSGLILSIDKGNGRFSTFVKEFIDGAIMIMDWLAKINKSVDDLALEKQLEAAQQQAAIYDKFKNGIPGQIVSLSDEDLFKRAKNDAERAEKEIEEFTKKLEEAKKSYEEADKIPLISLLSPYNWNVAKKAIEGYSLSLAEAKGKLEAANEVMNKKPAVNVTNTGTGNELSEEEIKKREKARLDFLKKQKEAENDTYALSQIRLKTQADLSKDFYNNEKNNLQERIDSVSENAQIEESISNSTLQHKLKNISWYDDAVRDLTQNEIDALIAGETIKRDLNDKEKVAIIQHQNELLAIQERYKKETSKLVDFDLSKFKKELDDKVTAKEKYLNQELIAENEFYKNLDDFRKNAEDKEREHQERIAAIKKKYLDQALQEQIDHTQDILDSTNLSGAEREEVERKLYALKLALSNSDVENYNDSAQKKLDAEKEYAERVKELSYELFRSVQDFANALFESKIANIDYEIQKNEDSHNKQIELAGDDIRKKEALQKQSEKKREELEKKKRKEQYQQALYNKAAAIVEIGINTAVAITKSLPDFVLAALAGAIGAVQLATVIATPLPKYKDGRKDGKEEFAVVGDGYRHEVIERKDGSISITPNKPTVTKLLEGDIVHSSIEDYNKIQKASIMTSLKLEKNKIDDYQANNIFNDYYAKELINETRLTRKALEKNKNNIIVKSPKIDINHAVWASKNKNWH